jgi:anti-sigma factor RsiW
MERPFVLPERNQAVVSCEEVLKELSNYLDDNLDSGLRQEIESHLYMCRRCSVVLDTTRKMISIFSDESVLEIPTGIVTGFGLFPQD